MSLIPDRATLFSPAFSEALPDARLAFYLRLGLAVATLSVVFEKLMDTQANPRMEIRWTGRTVFAVKGVVCNDVFEGTVEYQPPS